jgi:hypothetical protein
MIEPTVMWAFLYAETKNNRKEVTNEILNDLSKLQKGAINRQTDEYGRERRKYKKIRREAIQNAMSQANN